MPVDSRLCRVLSFKGVWIRGDVRWRGSLRISDKLHSERSSTLIDSLVQQGVRQSARAFAGARSGPGVATQ